MGVITCLCLAACGYPALDAGSDAGPPSTGGPLPPVAGSHFGYVVSQADLPASTADAESPAFGIDFASPTSATPDGLIDNQLSLALGTLGNIGFDAQTSIADGINQGQILMLVDLQTQSFSSAASSGISVKLGANPTPTPCTNPGDPTSCGQHLKGTGSFAIASGSPDNSPLAGPIAGGTLTAGPGTLAIQIALDGLTSPAVINLKNARIQATQISATGMAAVIGGAVTSTDLKNSVMVAVFNLVTAALLRDCGQPATRTGSMCNCSIASAGFTLLNIFEFIDQKPPICAPTLTDVINSDFMQTLFVPDVCTTASCSEPDGLSFGMKISAVKATFPMQ